MFCTQCGNRLDEGMRFCTSCGKPVGSSAPLGNPAAQDPNPNGGAASFDLASNAPYADQNRNASFDVGRNDPSADLGRNTPSVDLGANSPSVDLGDNAPYRQAPAAGHQQNGNGRLEAVPVSIDPSALEGDFEHTTTMIGQLSGDMLEPAPPVVVLNRRSTGTSYRLNVLPATVGKGSAADVIIEGNPSISRVHLTIGSIDGVIAVEDMGSMNGTRINGTIIRPGERRALTHGDVLIIANEDFAITFE